MARYEVTVRGTSDEWALLRVLEGLARPRLGDERGPQVHGSLPNAVYASGWCANSYTPADIAEWISERLVENVSVTVEHTTEHSFGTKQLRQK